jgi:hypothetical protein
MYHKLTMSGDGHVEWSLFCSINSEGVRQVDIVHTGWYKVSITLGSKPVWNVIPRAMIKGERTPCKDLFILHEDDYQLRVAINDHEPTITKREVKLTAHTCPKE